MKVLSLLMEHYPLQYKLSDKAKPKYLTNKSKVSKRVQAMISHYNEQGLAIDKNGSIMIANPQDAGKPRFKTINGQSIWNGSIQTYERSKLAEYLHNYFKLALSLKQATAFPLIPNHYYQIEYISYMPFKLVKAQDALNHFYPYMKTFEDTCTELQLWPDDSPNYVRGGYYRYVNVQYMEQRALEINIHLLYDRDSFFTPTRTETFQIGNDNRYNAISNVKLNLDNAK